MWLICKLNVKDIYIFSYIQLTHMSESWTLPILATKALSKSSNRYVKWRCCLLYPYLERVILWNKEIMYGKKM